ncbi:MAG: AAA family ATPase, partial [Prevotellaceae bacterium]|nr:AAA family ATPase [Prevotellaceae bacterium]
MKEQNNPFLIKGYKSAELFCDRENEIEKLYQHAQNGIDTTLISPRRMGKTGLIFRFFDFLKNDKSFKSVYVDIYSARSLSDFIKLLLEAVLKQFPETTGIGKKFFNLIKSLRPLISYDSITGNPQLQILYQTEGEKQQTLQSLLNFLDSQDTKMLLAIDEFQQIASFPEKNIEALLRTYIQQVKNIQFIFCGSRKDMMTAIFSSAKRPFYASTQYVALDKIDRNVYANFITKTFKKQNIEIEQNALDFVMDWTKGYTFYTQSVCNTLFSIADKNIDIELVKKACTELLKNHEAAFFQYRKLLTPAQWNVLIAIAKEGEISQITSKNFVGKYNIGSPADVRRIVKALIDKELLL